MYSVLLQQIEKSNSNSIQIIMSNYNYTDQDELLINLTEYLKKKTEISVREMLTTDEMLLFNNYFNTDFIGQYFLTTPSLSEEFGSKREVDIVIIYQLVEFMKKLGLFNSEKTLLKDGYFKHSPPFELIMRVKDSSNTWIDYRSIYLEPKIEINFEKKIKTEDSSFMIEAKSGRISFNNVKIQKIEVKITFSLNCMLIILIIIYYMYHEQIVSIEKYFYLSP